MSDLSEFLLARIAEDEAVARTAQNVGAYPHFGDDAAEESWVMAKHEGCSPDGYRFHRHNHPARVLAECEAKRRIVDLATNQHTSCIEYDEILPILALPYADHRDYMQEWRP